MYFRFKSHIWCVARKQTTFCATAPLFSRFALPLLACQRESISTKQANKTTVYLSKLKNRGLTQRGLYTEEKIRGLGILTSVGLQV